MHDHAALFIGALLIFLFGLVSRRAEHYFVTGPMIFVTAGVLLSPLGFGLVEMHFNAPSAQLLAEITLIVILFIDASMIRFGKLKEALAGLPARLLGIGLPLTMLLGTLVAYLLFPEINLWLLALVALILSPTDAALGQAVIKSDAVPQRVRDSVSIESGLNDGIALPPILLCIAVLAEGNGVIDGSGDWLRFLTTQLTLGPIIGAAVGLAGGRLVEIAATRGLSEPTFQQLAAVSLALMAYAFAELFHGNGFIAAFFAGLFLGARTQHVRERIQEFGEAEGQLFSLFVFLLLGLVMIPTAVEYWSPRLWLYACLSLTLVRMVPVAISLIGSRYDLSTVLFVGWFGPRGIASVLYLLIVLGELGFAGYESALSVVVLTVTLSTFLHGISAVPLAKIYGGRSRPD